MYFNTEIMGCKPEDKGILQWSFHLTDFDLNIERFRSYQALSPAPLYNPYNKLIIIYQYRLSTGANIYYIRGVITYVSSHEY
jgi:hypothetical protein